MTDVTYTVQFKRDGKWGYTGLTIHETPDAAFDQMEQLRQKNPDTEYRIERYD